MITLTKIFHFEMAHAIKGYEGACKNIHGHSYELYVTVSSADETAGYIPAPGFIIDFKDIKKNVQHSIIEKLDHCLLVSKDYLAENPAISSQENLVIFEAEPTAENLLTYVSQVLQNTLPAKTKLFNLKLFETKDSYAEWHKI